MCASVARVVAERQKSVVNDNHIHILLCCNSVVSAMFEARRMRGWVVVMARRMRGWVVGVV